MDDRSAIFLLLCCFVDERERERDGSWDAGGFSGRCEGSPEHRIAGLVSFSSLVGTPSWISDLFYLFVLFMICG